MPKTAPLSDSQIHAEVLDELTWDIQVDETDVGVEVDNGVVTLTGTVESYAKKVAAQDAAHRVRGVLDVVNDVEVRTPASPGRSDTEIAHGVRQALEWDALVPHENIHTTVENGWVTLDGSVPRFADRLTVEQTVRRLVGVCGISNRLTVVNPTPSPSPSAIRGTIELALERRAEREARKIEVDVHGNDVTLSGAVHSWGDRQAVVNAAAHAPGVRHLEDTITIDPY